MKEQLENFACIFISLIFFSVKSFIKFQSIKIINHNDCNLRSHLGRKHHMSELMYNSQRQQLIPKPSYIKPEKKREFHEAAIDCIITDGRSFNDFRRPGMDKFLNVIYPG